MFLYFPYTSGEEPSILVGELATPFRAMCELPGLRMLVIGFIFLRDFLARSCTMDYGLYIGDRDIERPDKYIIFP